MIDDRCLDPFRVHVGEALGDVPKTFATFRKVGRKAGNIVVLAVESQMETGLILPEFRRTILVDTL